MVLGILGLVLLAGFQEVLAQGFPTDGRTMTDDLQTVIGVGSVDV